MASRRSGKRKSKVIKNEYLDDVLSEDEQKDDDLGVAEEPVTSYNSISTVKLQLRKSARVIANGPVTGKRYIFERAGAIVEVDAKDVPGLLEKHLGNKTCCGSPDENLRYFTLVE